MATYFIDTDDGDVLVTDEQGIALPNDDAARMMGLRALSEMVSDKITAGKKRTFIVGTRRPDGSLVYTAAPNFKASWS